MKTFKKLAWVGTVFGVAVVAGVAAGGTGMTPVIVAAVAAWVLA